MAFRGVVRIKLYSGLDLTL